MPATTSPYEPQIDFILNYLNSHTEGDAAILRKVGERPRKCYPDLMMPKYYKSIDGKIIILPPASDITDIDYDAAVIYKDGKDNELQIFDYDMETINNLIDKSLSAPDALRDVEEIIIPVVEQRQSTLFGPFHNHWVALHYNIATSVATIIDSKKPLSSFLFSHEKTVKSALVRGLDIIGKNVSSINTIQTDLQNDDDVSINWTCAAIHELLNGVALDSIKTDLENNYFSNGEAKPKPPITIEIETDELVIGSEPNPNPTITIETHTDIVEPVTEIIEETISIDKPKDLSKNTQSYYLPWIIGFSIPTLIGLLAVSRKRILDLTNNIIPYPNVASTFVAVMNNDSLVNNISPLVTNDLVASNIIVNNISSFVIDELIADNSLVTNISSLATDELVASNIIVNNISSFVIDELIADNSLVTNISSLATDELVASNIIVNNISSLLTEVTDELIANNSLVTNTVPYAIGLTIIATILGGVIYYGWTQYNNYDNNKNNQITPGPDANSFEVQAKEDTTPDSSSFIGYIIECLNYIIDAIKNFLNNTCTKVVSCFSMFNSSKDNTFVGAEDLNITNSL